MTNQKPNPQPHPIDVTCVRPRHLRAHLATYLDADTPTFIGSRRHARAILLPVQNYNLYTKGDVRKAIAKLRRNADAAIRVLKAGVRTT